jgi:dipeptidyl aminopeptidase/acylaminoacyl peptidase
MNRFILILIAFGFFTFSTFSQLSDKSQLKLDEIMKGNEFIGHQPENFQWNINSDQIYFDWNKDNNPFPSTYVFSFKDYNQLITKTKYHKIDAKERAKQVIQQAKYPSIYYVYQGGLWKFTKKTAQDQLIFKSTEAISNIQRTSEKNVFFQLGNSIFSYTEPMGEIRQLTDFKKELKSSKQVDSSFTMKEELALFHYNKTQQSNEAYRTKTRSIDLFKAKEIAIGSFNLENLQVAKNGEYITFRLSDYPDEQATEVGHYIAKNGQSYHENARPKVALQQPTHRLGIYNVTKDTVLYLDFSKLSGIRVKPAYLKDTIAYQKDRNLAIHTCYFSPNQTQALIDVRAYDNKDRWLVIVDLATGTMREIDRQHDDAWIGGPGIDSWDESEGTLGWINDATVYFQSEKTGYSHLYSYELITHQLTALTEGKWEVHKAILSADAKKFFLTSNQSHPGNRSFYHLEIASKKIIPIFTNDGYYDVEVSPNEQLLAIRYSTSNKPWELYYAVNKTGSKLYQITTSTTPAFNAYAWRKPLVIQLKASDGIEIYARLYKANPEKKTTAAVQFVHGAGYLQNAHNYWSNYAREYMFHNLLADEGITVLDIDYRASEGYGRDYRTAIYREMGGRDLQDQLDGKKYLVQNEGIDSNRVGIYGGSYGGFITLMALLKTPNTFKCGAALRSVTDWAHYNNDYTANILNYPETDPEAYRISSPIYYAENLSNRLIMLHGMIDDNVQFQDVVRLSQRFIELKKTNWDIAIYPVERHGFVIATSWLDEYRRIYDLFQTELQLKK